MSIIKHKLLGFALLVIALSGVAGTLSSCASSTPVPTVIRIVVTRIVTPTPSLQSKATSTPTPGPTERVLEIQETDRKIRIVGENRIPARNCGGKNEIEFSQALSHSIRRHIDVGAKGGISIGSLKLSWLKAELEAHYNFQEGTELTQTVMITVHAKPGTNAVYRVVWKEVSVTGYMVVQMDNGERVRVPFTVTQSLEGEVLDPVEIGCPPTPVVKLK